MQYFPPIFTFMLRFVCKRMQENSFCNVNVYLTDYYKKLHLKYFSIIIYSFTIEDALKHKGKYIRRNIQYRVTTKSPRFNELKHEISDIREVKNIRWL